MTRKRSAARVAMLATALLACGPTEELSDDWATDPTGASDFSVPRVDAPDAFINDPVALRTLAERLPIGRPLGLTGANDTLMRSPAYAALVTTIETDLAEMKANDRKAGVGLAYEHRLFDSSWLRMAAATFELVGVVNRADLAHRDPGGCGEVRFLYRLGYATAQGTSRLPMTMNVGYLQRPRQGTCQTLAAAWQAAAGNPNEVSALLASVMDATQPTHVEINLQAVRWPAVTRSDMGGHAEYLLRAFSFDAGALQPKALPNTIRMDLTASEKRALAQWIVANIDAIDQGSYLIPAEFLATRAISASPRGLARGANRPFRVAFPTTPVEFDAIAYDRLGLIKSPGGLLRRLDTQTCQGCHQSRSMAGFHLLGEEPEGAFAANALAVGSSPHLNDELAWRSEVVDAIANGRASSPQPFAERGSYADGRYGAHCGLTNDPTLSAWTCSPGFVCKDINGDEVGMCVRDEDPGVGDTCETSVVSFTANPTADQVSQFKVQPCGFAPTGARGYCNRSGTRPHTTSAFGGFPNGSCAARCLTMGKFDSDAICGAQPPEGFNDCIGSGRPFAQCLANATPEFRRRCDANTPCGDDYVCAGVPGAPKGVGACMPPYFVFQVRVDGHRVR